MAAGRHFTIRLAGQFVEYSPRGAWCFFQKPCACASFRGQVMPLEMPQKAVPGAPQAGLELPGNKLKLGLKSGQWKWRRRCAGLPEAGSLFGGWHVECTCGLDFIEFVQVASTCFYEGAEGGSPLMGAGFWFGGTPPCPKLTMHPLWSVSSPHPGPELADVPVGQLQVGCASPLVSLRFEGPPPHLELAMHPLW